MAHPVTEFTQVVPSKADGTPYGDTEPFPVEMVGPAGAATAYTEDAAAPADPVAPALSLVRRDTLSASEVSADNDIVTLKGTSKGQAHVKDADLIAALTASAGVKSNVSDTATSTTILAANSARKGFMVWNDSTAILYLDLSGGTASATSFSVKVPPDGAYWDDFGYTGLVTGIWASDASGAARVTEFT